MLLSSGGFAGPAQERGGDDQRGAIGMLHDICGAGGIPRGVAAGFKGGAKAAGREAAGIGLALDQFLAAEYRKRARTFGREEAVVFLGSDAGHRLEEVRVVRRAVFQSPVAHGGGHGIGNGGIEGSAFVNRLHQAFECRLGKAGLHLRFAENIRPEYFLQVNCLEIHVGKLVLGQGDCLDRLLASIRHNSYSSCMNGWFDRRGLKIMSKRIWNVQINLKKASGVISQTA